MRCGNGPITEKTVSNSYNNDAYYIGSGEQVGKNNSDNSIYNVSDMKPQEHYYASIYNPPVSSTNHSAVPLTFPAATAETKGEEATPSIYQPLNGGATASIYQSVNSDPKIPEVQADNKSEGAATKFTD